VDKKLIFKCLLHENVADFYGSIRGGGGGLLTSSACSSSFERLEAIFRNSPLVQSLPSTTDQKEGYAMG